MKQIFLLSFLLSIASALFAQAPQSFNYQGVARNAQGQPYNNQSIQIRLSLRSGAPSGNIEYREERTVTTNAFGLFTVQIGSAGAANIQGDFSTISWSTGTKFLQTEIKLVGQPSFTDLGTTQLMSAPYAIHAKEARQLVLPFDTSVGTNQNNAFRIKGDGVYSTMEMVSTKGVAVYGVSDSSAGVRGLSSKAGVAGISGFNNTNGGFGVQGNTGIGSVSSVGVYGKSGNGTGVKGESSEYTGVIGSSVNQHGVNGYSTNGIGVLASSTNNAAISGLSGNSNGIVGSTGKSGFAGVVGYSSYVDGTIGVLAETDVKGTALVAKATTDGIAADIRGKIKITGPGQSPGDGKVLTSDANGNATWKHTSTIAFRASGLLNDATQSVADATDKKIMFNQNTRYNIGNSYDGPNSIFFPPVSGIYHLDVNITWRGADSYKSVQLKLLRNGQVTTLAHAEGSRVSTDIRLEPNDAVWVVAYQSNSGNSSRTISEFAFETWFTGHLIMRL